MDCFRKALTGSAHSKDVYYFRNYFKPSIRNVTKNEVNDGCSFDKEPNIEISLLSDYKDLATFTNGYYVAVMNKNDTKYIVAGMNGRTDWQTVNAAVAFDITTTTLDFAVDDTMKYLEIRIISLYGDSISDLMLKVTLGGKEIFPTDESLISDTMRVIDFAQPSIGMWTLEITNILSQTLSIFVRSTSVLDLNMRMLSSITSGTMGQPTAGEMYNIYVECPNCKTVDKIIVKLCADYSVKYEGSATYLQSFEWWYLENATLPAEMICIQVQGKTLNGNVFSRIIDKKVLPSTIAIRGSMIPLEIYSNQTGSLKFIIINNGSSDTFIVTLNNSAGSTLSFYQQSYNIDSFSSANDTVQISINDSSITTVNIELTITSQNMPVQSNFATFYLNVLPMNPDLDAPICEIISDDNSSCIETCIGNTYKVQIQFYDNITGIARTSYTNGKWNIPNNNTFGNGANNNITYTATGIINCCENYTQFYVFDQNGLIGKCEFTNNPTFSTLLPTSSTEKPTKSNTNYPCSKYSVFLGFFIFIIYNVLF